MSFHRLFRWFVAAVSIALIPWVPVANAQESAFPPTMLIFDNSGSMTTDDAGGQTRIEAAKEAAHDFIDSSSNIPLGLVTYGGNTDETEADRDAGCRDITMVTEPGTDTANEMLAHIDGLEPRGYTPIGESLKTAADQLPDDGPRTIVLVSDGIDTCAPPPVCEVASDLKDQGVDLVINTVGFAVDDDARQELQCIADASGGTYADASDAVTLAEELRRATYRTYQAYESDLEHIDGGSSAANPAEVGRDVEEFSTTLPSLPKSRFYTESSEVFYRLPVTEGERVIVSARTTQVPSLDNWGNGTLIFSPWLEDTSCQLESESGSDTTVEGYKTATLYTTEIGAGDCDSEDVIIRLTREGNWRFDEDIDVDVTVTRLGAADMSGLPEPVTEASDPPSIQASEPPAEEPRAESESVSPGTWFDDASELKPGESVRMEIVPGETQYFKFPVKHGQRLVGRIATVEESNNFEDNGPGDRLMLEAFNDARAQVRLNNGSVTANNTKSKDFGYEAPILFTNRYGGADGEGSGSLYTEGYWQDGDQYLTVQYGKLFSKEQIDAQTELPVLTYELVLDAVGEPVPGPKFTAINATDSETSSTQSSEKDTTDTADDVEATTAEDDGSTSPVLWLVLGGVIIVGAIIAVALIVTRKKGSGSGSQ